MPESIKSCGELMTPPASNTSRSACATLRSPFLQILDADGAAAVKDDARGESIDQHVEIGAAERRPQIRCRGTAPPSVANGHLQPAEAFGVGAVVILGDRIAGRFARGEIGLHQRIVIVGWTRRQRPVAAAIGVCAAGPGFLATKVGQDVGIRPARASQPPPSGRSLADGRGSKPSRSSPTSPRQSCRAHTRSGGRSSVARAR